MCKFTNANSQCFQCDTRKYIASEYDNNNIRLLSLLLCPAPMMHPPMPFVIQYLVVWCHSVYRETMIRWRVQTCIANMVAWFSKSIHRWPTRHNACAQVIRNLNNQYIPVYKHYICRQTNTQLHTQITTCTQTHTHRFNVLMCMPAKQRGLCVRGEMGADMCKSCH